MAKQQPPRSTGRLILMAIAVGVVSAIAVVLAQKLFLGEINPAVTGGVVGAVTGSMVALDVARARKQGNAGKR